MWYDQLKRIENGDTLFTVKALTAPPGVPGSDWVDIARITLTTDMYTSVFGDERLFFQHARTGADRAYWPQQWLRPDARNDPRINQTAANTWGTFVPEGVWPVNQDEARDMFAEQEA